MVRLMLIQLLPLKAELGGVASLLSLSLLLLPLELPGSFFGVRRALGSCYRRDNEIEMIT